MPIVRVSYPEGALTLDHKRRLAASLTEVVLQAEVDRTTEMGKAVTVIQFNPGAPHDWSLGGVLRCDAQGDAPSHFIVDVYVLEGLVEGERRSMIHRGVTAAFKTALADKDDPMLPLRVWVLVHEVREGSWGAAGMTVSALDVAQFLDADLDPTLRATIARVKPAVS